MEGLSAASRVPRSRQRRRQSVQSFVRQDIDQQDARRSPKQRKRPVHEKAVPVRAPDELDDMDHSHQKFHHRAIINVPQVLTVAVQVIATVDSAGNIIGQQTIAPALPSVPPMPTDPIPQVPAVPPFPTALVVPAYPWPSGVPSAAAVPVSALDVKPTSAAPPPATPVASNSPSSSNVSRDPSRSSNISSAQASSSENVSTSQVTATLSSAASTTTPIQTSASASSSSALPTTPSPTQSAFSLISSQLSAASSTVATSNPSSSNPANVAPGVNPANTGAAAHPSSTSAVAGTQAENTPVLGTPQVVGTVFGSLAGAALLLALILFVIRRHKQTSRRGVMQLGEDDGDHVPMTHDTSKNNAFLPPAFLNRFSAASRSTAESSGTGERSFQRVSGRKLPSAFSEGLTSEQFARGEGTLSGASFYKDDTGFYGGPGIMSKDFAKDTGPTGAGAAGAHERWVRSPARTPVIRHPDEAPWGTPRSGGGSALSPPHTPTNTSFLPAGTLGRSRPSQDGSRSSRFTENV